MGKDCITDRHGNEEIMERFIHALLDGTCLVTKDYPYQYILSSGEHAYDTPIVEYYFESLPFNKDEAIALYEAMRKLKPDGYYGIRYQFDQWVERTLQEPYFNKFKNERGHWEISELKVDTDIGKLNPQMVSFLCFLAVAHIKYGPSWASISANEYFVMVTALGSDEVARLKKCGTGNLPKSMTEYKDSDISFRANDAFATIRISLKNDTEDAYRKALTFTNNLIGHDFPKSYSIECSCKEKRFLPIKGMPRKGVQLLFAGAVQYKALWPVIEEYANLAMNEFEWYNNLEDEYCAMPGTFAVFALGLADGEYSDLVKRYMQLCDYEHSLLQQKFTPVFVEQYGVNDKTLPVIIACLLSTQNHKKSRELTEAFSTEEALTLLIDCKEHFADYLSDTLKEDIAGDSEEEQTGLYELWNDICHTLFGNDLNRNKLLKNASENMRPLYEKIFERYNNHG
jgi:hypothetical protein